MLTLLVDIIRQEVENGVWLMHADFSSDIELLNKEHLDGTSGWFTAMDKVRSWIDPQSAERLLWVHGKPGTY